MRLTTFHPRLPLHGLAGCLGIAALSLSAPGWAQETAETTSVDDVQAEIAQAFDTIGRYTADERDEALAALRTTLERLDQEIEATEDRARTRWSDMTQDARERTSGALADLRIGRNRLSQTYGALSQSADSAWDDLLAGMREDWNALETAWDNAAIAAGPETETGY